MFAGILPVDSSAYADWFCPWRILSVGATIAAAIVSPDKRAGAIALMFAGLTVAMVTGVPLGTFIGQQLGWRATFTGVTIPGGIGLLANLLLLPRNISNRAAGSRKEQPLPACAIYYYYRRLRC